MDMKYWKEDFEFDEQFLEEIKMAAGISAQKDNTYQEVSEWDMLLDDSNIFLDKSYLVPNELLYRSDSELNIEELMRSDPKIEGEFESDREFRSFVGFVKKYYNMLHTKGYDTPRKCLAGYNYCLKLISDEKCDIEKALPHMRRLEHPVYERMKYPGPGEPLTPEFIDYAHNCLKEEETANPSPEFFMILCDQEGSDVQMKLVQLLNYAKYYQLWGLTWRDIVKTYVEIIAQTGRFREGEAPYEPNHVPPVPKGRRKGSYNDLKIKSHKYREQTRQYWLRRNKDAALQYLRKRRQHEHERRYNPELPEFDSEPPLGMEKIARSRIEYDVENEDKYRHEAVETTLFGETPAQDEYSYFESLGVDENIGTLNYQSPHDTNSGVLPNLGLLYKESLLDPDVLHYEKIRKMNERSNSNSVKWATRQHKQGDQWLVTDPFGQEDGVYLTRPRKDTTEPASEANHITPHHSDEVLGKISTLSLASLPLNTEHNTDIERRKLLLKMDEITKYNKKLVAIFEDVVDHIGPDSVAPPTQHEFDMAQQYLANKKLDYNKLIKCAQLKAASNERTDLLEYYNAVKQFIDNSARDLAHEARSTIEDIKKFVEAIQGNDEDIIVPIFDDVIGPSCRKYLEDLNYKDQQIENFMQAVEKLKVYHSLMKYKDVENQTLFEDDIYHEIVQHSRQVNSLIEKIRNEERLLEEAKKSHVHAIEKITDVEKVKERYNERFETLQFYIDKQTSSMQAHQEGTLTRLEMETADLKKELAANEIEIQSKGLACDSSATSKNLDIVELEVEQIEANNTYIMSDLTSIDCEIQLYEVLLQKKTEIVDRYTEENKHCTSNIRVYQKQLAAKQVYLTQHDQQTRAEHLTMAQQLAKNVKVKTEVLLKHFKSQYDKEKEAHEQHNKEHIQTAYNRNMDQYEEKIAELNRNLNLYREVTERKARLEVATNCALEETKQWKSMALELRNEYTGVIRDNRDIKRKLRDKLETRDKLTGILSTAEKRSKINEEFGAHAEKTLHDARKAKVSPSEAAFGLLVQKVKDITRCNQKRQLRIKKVLQDMKIREKRRK